MISTTGERTTWPTSRCGDHRQQMVLQGSAVFNRHERKAGARNRIICRDVFDGEANAETVPEVLCWRERGFRAVTETHQDPDFSSHRPRKKVVHSWRCKPLLPQDWPQHRQSRD